jgi:hypothetical protein
VCQHIKRVPIPAEYIRWLWFKRLDQTLTSVDDLVGQLGLLDIKAHKRTVDWHTARQEISRAYSDGKLSCILGYWLTPSIGHWMVVVETTEDGIICRDPWSGSLVNKDWGTFYNQYMGTYVHVDQLPDRDMVEA